jgi:hypothetical protein
VNFLFVWSKNGLNEGIPNRSYANIGDKATLGIFAASSLAEHTPLNVAQQWPQEAPRKPPKKSLTDDAKPWGALPQPNFGYEDKGTTSAGDKATAPTGDARSPATRGHAADASADAPGAWSSWVSNPFGSKAPAASAASPPPPHP